MAGWLVGDRLAGIGGAGVGGWLAAGQPVDYYRGVVEKLLRNCGETGGGACGEIVETLWRTCGETGGGACGEIVEKWWRNCEVWWLAGWLVPLL